MTLSLSPELAEAGDEPPVGRTDACKSSVTLGVHSALSVTKPAGFKSPPSVTGSVSIPPAGEYRWMSVASLPRTLTAFHSTKAQC